MSKVLLVARSVFRGILDRRILYFWVAAVAMLFVMAAPVILFDFGNEALQAALRQRALSGALNRWSALCIALTIFLGASAIGRERSWKTIVTVFARPVPRWQFLLGKWLGVLVFSLVSLLLGLAAAIALSIYVGADFNFKVLGISLAQSIAAIVLYSGLAIAISSIATSWIAGAVTVLVFFVPGAVTYLVESSDSLKHASGVVLDFVIPPGYTSHYEGTIDVETPVSSFNYRNRLPGRRPGDIPPLVMPTSPQSGIDYDVEYREVFENLGYAAAFFVLGCLVFSRRDLTLVS